MTIYSDQELVDGVLDCDGQIEAYRNLRAHYVQEIEVRLTERDARSLPVTGAEVLRPLGTAVYDYAALAKLRELHSADELGKAYVAAWDEPVPAHTLTHEEKWDGRVLNTLKDKFGGETRDIIEAATTRNPMAVKITKRE